MISSHISRSIDIIRGLAALGVIWGHSMYSLNLPTELNGAFWVWIFLPISGYLIGKSFLPVAYGLSPSGYTQFLRNRALRIIPLYELALFLGLIMDLTVSSDGICTVIANLNQFFFMSPLNKITLSGPLWTVVIEIHFYIVSIVLAYVILKIKGSIILQFLVWLISLYVSSWYIGSVNDLIIQPRTFVGNVPFFLFGIILATGKYDGYFRVSKVTKLGSIVLLIALAWILNNWFPEYFWSIGPKNLFGIGPIFRKYIPLGGASFCALIICFIVLCTEVKDEINNCLSTIKIHHVMNFMAWCGFFTYGIYVWHSVLAKANQVYFHIMPGLMCLFLLMLSLPIAYFSYKFIELPMLKFKYSRSG